MTSDIRVPSNARGFPLGSLAATFASTSALKCGADQLEPADGVLAIASCTSKGVLVFNGVAASVGRPVVEKEALTLH